MARLAVRHARELLEHGPLERRERRHVDRRGRTCRGGCSKYSSSSRRIGSSGFGERRTRAPNVRASVVELPLGLGVERDPAEARARSRRRAAARSGESVDVVGDVEEPLLGGRRAEARRRVRLGTVMRSPLCAAGGRRTRRPGGPRPRTSRAPARCLRSQVVAVAKDDRRALGAGEIGRRDGRAPRRPGARRAWRGRARSAGTGRARRRSSSATRVAIVNAHARRWSAWRSFAYARSARRNVSWNASSAGLAAEQPHEVAVDLVPVRVVEALERRCGPAGQSSWSASWGVTRAGPSV